MTSDGGQALQGGFPAGARYTSVPSAFFSDVLPAITDPVELTVTLYAFYLLGRKTAGRRWFTDVELRAEAPLTRALARLERDREGSLQRGLDAAVRRGTLLRAVRPGETRSLSIYALHAPGAARMLTQLGAVEEPPAVIEAGGAMATPLANIFVLYEENIGVISPLLAERLHEAEATYRWSWIEAAFREAVALNRRNWRYIERILERWQTEGPDLEAIGRPVQSGRRSLAGKYWRLVKH